MLDFLQNVVNAAARVARVVQAVANAVAPAAPITQGINRAVDGLLGERGGNSTPAPQAPDNSPSSYIGSTGGTTFSADDAPAAPAVVPVLTPKHKELRARQQRVRELERQARQNEVQPTSNLLNENSLEPLVAQPSGQVALTRIQEFLGLDIWQDDPTHVYRMISNTISIAVQAGRNAPDGNLLAVVINALVSPSLRSYESSQTQFIQDTTSPYGTVDVAGTQAPIVGGQWYIINGRAIYLFGSVNVASHPRYAVDVDLLQTPPSSAPFPPNPDNIQEYHNYYMLYVWNNRDVYLKVAEVRLNELKANIRALPESVKENVPDYVLEEILNMTPAEYAARMAAIPLASNVEGWLSQAWMRSAPSGVVTKINPDGGELDTGQRIIYGLSQFLTPASMIGQYYFGSSIPYSAGYLELKWLEYKNLAEGITSLPLNNDVNVQVLPIQAATFEPITNIGFEPAPYGRIANLNAYNEYVLINNFPGNAWKAESLAEISAVRLEREMLKYVAEFNNPDLGTVVNVTDPDTLEVYSGWDMSQPHFYWYLSSPTAYAITEARAGFDSSPQGTNPPILRPEEIAGAYYNYNNSIFYFRSMFGSQDTSMIINPGFPNQPINPLPYEGS